VAQYFAIIKKNSGGISANFGPEFNLLVTAQLFDGYGLGFGQKIP
jgi:hypothetical protein